MHQRPQRGDRLAAWIGLLAGGGSVLFWVLRFLAADFAEPLQVAVTGYFAPWREIGPNRFVVAVGTSRHTNDIVLFDRKASPEHLTFERQGGSGRFWAILHNRSRDRRIVIRPSPSAPPQEITRFLLRDGDIFFWPRPSSPLPSTDWCSPADLLSLLRLTSPSDEGSEGSDDPKGGEDPKQPKQPKQPKHPKESKESKEPKEPKIAAIHTTRYLPFRVRESRLPVAIWRYRASLSFAASSSSRTPHPPASSQTLELQEHQRYTIPPEAGGGQLEFRHKRWHIRKGQGPWQAIQGRTPLGSYGTIEIKRSPLFLSKGRYWLQEARTDCPFELLPSALPAGIEIAGVARLAFEQGRLFLQHLGQIDRPLQIQPSEGPARQLGRLRIENGARLTFGQASYRVTFEEKGLRLLLETTPPSRPLLPFFAWNPSENIPTRQSLQEGRPLVLTGGEGEDPSADRFVLPIPLVGEAGRSQVQAPYRPFLRISPIPNSLDRLRIEPLEEAPLFIAQADGQLKTPISKPTEIAIGSTTYFTKRLYLRIFRPSYAPLMRWIALLWLIVAGGAVLLLFFLIQIQALPFLPAPPLAEPDASTPGFGRRLGSFLLSALGRLLLPLLFPLALALNGLGLYVLSALSLSSLGLNNNDFLYRQLLWSLVGIAVFLAVLVWPPGLALRLWRRWRPPPPLYQKVSAPLLEAPGLPPWFWIASGSFSLVSLVASFAFQIPPLAVCVGLLLGLLIAAWLTIQIRASNAHPFWKRRLRTLGVTVFLLGIVPLLGLLIPPLVHNRFFLKLGPLTLKLSEFAILSAVFFFVGYLAPDLYALHLTRSRRLATAKQPQYGEIRRWKRFWEQAKSSLEVSAFYLLLLGLIGALYTAQGDLGPGLILTLCFSLFLIFAFFGPGADWLTTSMNLLRLGFVFGAILLFVGVPEIIISLFPDIAAQSGELQKVRERLALWQQPWRFLVGEQILQNQWDLAGYKDAFQWFNNLHSDFVFTAVVRVLSPFWGLLVLLSACLWPLFGLLAARLRWSLPNADDPDEILASKQILLQRALILFFCGLYLFAQNAIHIGSVLRLTPMTGVTLPWISSGGTSLIVCYLILAVMIRQMRSEDPQTPASPWS